MILSRPSASNDPEDTAPRSALNPRFWIQFLKTHLFLEPQVFYSLYTYIRFLIGYDRVSLNEVLSCGTSRRPFEASDQWSSRFDRIAFFFYLVAGDGGAEEGALRGVSGEDVLVVEDATRVLSFVLLTFRFIGPSSVLNVFSVFIYSLSLPPYLIRLYEVLVNR